MGHLYLGWQGPGRLLFQRAAPFQLLQPSFMADSVIGLKFFNFSKGCSRYRLLRGLIGWGRKVKGGGGRPAAEMIEAIYCQKGVS